MMILPSRELSAAIAGELKRENTSLHAINQELRDTVVTATDELDALISICLEHGMQENEFVSTFIPRLAAELKAARLLLSTLNAQL